MLPYPALTALTVLGLEMALAGGVWTLVRLAVSPGAVFNVYGLVTILSVLLARGLTHRPTIGDLVASVMLSFVASLPGVLFFVELLHRNGRLCEDLPMLRMSLLWILVGPVLLALSRWFTSPEPAPTSLTVVQVTHLIACLVASGNAFMCAMTI